MGQLFNVLANKIMRLFLFFAVIGFILNAPIIAQDSDNKNVQDTAWKSSVPNSFAPLIKQLLPSVVNISVTRTIFERGLGSHGPGSPLEEFNDLYDRDDDGRQREDSTGSGFIIDPSGIIVTNYHVIEQAEVIYVTLSNGRTLRAELLGSDSETDLAVLKVNALNALPAVTFANSDKVAPGDWVIAIGNPFGLGGSVSAGIVSARGRDINSGAYDDYIQTDAAINRGNSGGPLFNSAGEVIGVNTAIFSETGGSIGIGFSVASNLAVFIVDKLRRYGKIERGWVGISIQPVTHDIAESYGLDEAKGALIVDVFENSPAKKAGLKIGDLIYKFDGEDIISDRRLSFLVAKAGTGVKVELEYIRKKRRGKLVIELAQRSMAGDEQLQTTPPAIAPILTNNALGVKLALLDDNNRRKYDIPASEQGAMIDQIDPNGPAFGKLRKGDVIQEIAYRPVASPQQAIAEIEDISITKDGISIPVLIKIYRQQRIAFYAIRIAPNS